MTDREKQKFDKISGKLKQVAQALLPLQLGEIPDKPETNKWYRYSPDGYICANGEPYYGLYKIGKENKLVVIFCGGGVALDDFTAARPSSFFNTTGEQSFYFEDVFFLADYLASRGLASVRDDNPFKDWSMIIVPYASGDFHAGTNDFKYKDSEKGSGVCHHHGYTNHRMLIDGIKKYIKNPDKLLVTGYSAGGFATALLTDSIVDCFPDCKDVTCCVDSALLIYEGWNNTAKNQWKAPKKIYDRLVSDNITLDSLIALHKKRNDIKIMFISSVKDAALVLYQIYIDRRGMSPTEDDGEKYLSNLCQTVTALKKEIKNIGFYIFTHPAEGYSYLTQHTIIMEPTANNIKSDGKTVYEWLWNGVNGYMEELGMDLLIQ